MDALRASLSVDHWATRSEVEKTIIIIAFASQGEGSWSRKPRVSMAERTKHEDVASATKDSW